MQPAWWTSPSFTSFSTDTLQLYLRKHYSYCQGLFQQHLKLELLPQKRIRLVGIGQHLFQVPLHVACPSLPEYRPPFPNAPSFTDTRDLPLFFLSIPLPKLCTFTPFFCAYKNHHPNIKYCFSFIFPILSMFLLTLNPTCLFNQHKVSIMPQFCNVTPCPWMMKCGQSTKILISGQHGQ